MSSSSAPRSDRTVDQVPGPAGYLVTVDGTEHRFVVPPGEPILTAARRAGVWLPFECGWGSCSTCKVTVLEGQVELLFPDAPALDPRDVRRSRSITCQATAASDLTLKVLRLGPVQERPTRDHVGVLAGVEPLGPGIHRFTFRLDGPGGRSVAEYRPGQYAILQLGPGLRRCYSMAGLPGGDEVRFVAKHYPGRPGSSALFGLPPGARVPMALPFGDFWLRPEGARDVLVAGGTGIAPILAMLQQLVAEGSRRSLLVLYGANTAAELACWPELLALASRLPGAELHGVLMTPGPGWPGRVGTVTDALDELAGPDDRFYLAGPPVMVDAALAVLRERGTGLDRVHHDRFG